MAGSLPAALGQQNTAQENFPRGENEHALAIQGFGAWSAADYRNGSDIQSDNYVADRARADAVYGLGEGQFKMKAIFPCEIAVASQRGAVASLPIDIRHDLVPMFALQPHSNVPLVQQIVAHFTGLIEEGKLRLGAKLPSIRQFAKTHSVSVFTVADAYDRLVAQGYLVSRANSGFFVKRMADVDASAAGTGVRRWAPFDAMWCLREVFENRDLALKPGCGWIPDGWLFNEGLQRGLRALAADGGDFGGYGDPQGYRPLRQSIRDVMLEQDITVSLAQILLTQGSSQALDLVARSLIKPGDAVLVDDPGYANLLHSLRFLGARLLGVPRSPDGYDLGALESLIKEHRPKVFLTQPRLHSPTGSVASLAQMHRVLNLIERHDMLLVENDIYADLDPLVRQSFASLDQLDRVIHIRSFSKALSPNLRVGYLLASADLVEDFAQMKMMSGLTSSEISERITHHVLMDGRWRKHLKALSGRLADAHGRTAERLLQLGFKLFAQPRAGLFLWAHHPELPDSDVLSAEAAENGIMMGPGHLYSTSLEATNWMRFNPAYCDDERIFDFLKTALAQRGAKPSIQAA